MISLKILFGVLIIHWFADFVLQTDDQANNKSTKWSSLLEHTATYSILWLGVSVLYWGVSKYTCHSILLFAPITFICHTATDYYTSKAHKQLYDNKEVHEFFASIGFDQLLHYTQLILTYKLLE